MANTAFEHSPTITVPGTGNSTDNAVVLWNGTTGNNFSNSTIIVGATTMGLAADTDLLTFGNGTLAITGTVTGVTALTASGAVTGGTLAGTVSTATQNSITTMTGLTTVGTVGTGTWQGTAVAQTYIAAQAINESKLQVSNGPTNGYVLTARDGVAGGFTWEAAGGGAFTATSGGADTYLTRYSAADAAVGSNKLTFTDASADFNINLSSANPYFRVTSYSTTDSHEPYIELRKSGHATIGSNAAVADAEPLGTIAWAGSTASGWSHGAKIYVKTNAPFDGSQEDARMYFAVKNSTSWVDVMTVADNTSGTVGVVGIGTTTPAAKLDVAGGDVKITGGNLVIGTSGKGIDFSAHGQASGMTSELLDDYEKGTWTPVLSHSSSVVSGPVYTGNTGYYTKIGNRVFYNGTLSTSATTNLSGGSPVYILGLPFSSVYVTGGTWSGTVAESAGLAITAGNTPTVKVNNGVSYMRVMNWDSTTGTSSMTITEWSADGGITFAGTYQTS